MWTRENCSRTIRLRYLTRILQKMGLEHAAGPIKTSLAHPIKIDSEPIAGVKLNAIPKTFLGFIRSIYSLYSFRTGKDLQRWFRWIIEGTWFRGSNRRWWAGVTEAFFATTMLLTGTVLFSAFVTLAMIRSDIEGTPQASWLYVVVQLAIATALFAIGLSWIARLIWHVGVSAERRGAIAVKAGQLEILNELRKRREDLPTIPRDRMLPQPGRRLAFQIVPWPRNIWGLISSAIFSMIAVALLSILVLICTKSYFEPSSLVQQLGALSEQITPAEISRISDRPWLAAALLFVFVPAAGWSIYHFFRQLIKLAGVGPTSIELSQYPLKPGGKFHLFLSQTGRVRLQLLELELICQENVTYNQGTDIRTESEIIFQQRLLRHRGATLSSGKPFEAELEFELPDSAMHSFKSTNNQVQWKIIVIAKAKNWPRLKRTFQILVFPNSRDSKHPVALADAAI